MISKSQIKQVRQLEQKKNRRSQQLFIAEGPKVVGDLLRAGFKPYAQYATTERPGCQLVSNEELSRISLLQHPQEILAVFHMPESPTLKSHPPRGLCLALDGVQDPGNLGTIIRIADWFGIDVIYCSPDTADVYNPKVVQATMGSLAHVPVVYCELTDLLSQTTLPVYGTLLDGTDIYRQELSSEAIIVMGNEGNGISPHIRLLISHRLLIPNFSQAQHTAESLNVAIATAITCAEFRRRG